MEVIPFWFSFGASKCLYSSTRCRSFKKISAKSGLKLHSGLRPTDELKAIVLIHLNLFSFTFNSFGMSIGKRSFTAYLQQDALSDISLTGQGP